jgi:two-component system sensor histidine kinase MtrB
VTVTDGAHARHGLGLRAKTGIAFAVLALVLSVSLAFMTYQLSRGYLLARRESFATREALANAHTVARLLKDPVIDRTTVLPNFSSTGGSGSLLRLDDEWFASTTAFSRATIPAGLRSLPDDRTARQRVTIAGTPSLVVAVPIHPNLGVYYQVFFLTELRSTLRTLAWVLGIAAAVTTLLGALIGHVASRRVLRPIAGMARTAVSIAGGHDTRLTTNDRDLAPFVSSFNGMVDALQERVDRETRFAADASHELRTPLTAIRAAIEVLERRVDDRARPALEILRRQTDRFEHLVLDLLEMSRFTPGSNALVLDDVDPVQFVEGVLRRIAHTQIPIEMEPSGPATVRLDCRRIERVLTNLIDNADHYGGGATRIVIGGTPETLRIAVDDAGPAVAVSERELIFERFHRADASRASTAPGTGLGLAIALEHCRLHGGRLTVDDSPDGGARFLIELPVAPT